MNVSKNLQLSIEILCGHSTRTFLSIAGIVIGIAVVIIMISTGKSTERKIGKFIEDMGSHLIIVSAGRVRTINASGKKQNIDACKTLLPGDAAEILKNCTSVSLAAPATDMKVTLRWNDNAASTTLIGTTSDYFPIRNISTGLGRTFTDEENRAKLRYAVIGQTVRENLFNDGDDPIGQKIRIGKVPFEVIGVMAPKGLDISGADQNDIILVPLNTMLRRLTNVSHVQNIYIQAMTLQSMKDAEREIAQILRSSHKKRASIDKANDDFSISNQVTLLETERESASAMTFLIASVAALSLIVGGVGIMAVMLISVRERTIEIGLRRAVGARKKDIRNQFFCESSLLAGGGGLGGIVIGITGACVFSVLGFGDVYISGVITGGAVVFSCLIGIIFGIYPAIKAANLEPIDALKRG